MNLPDCSIDEKLNVEKCQKFTDSKVAEAMLDLIGYTGSVYGKKVLENSFGSGVFLEKIVTRYIEASQLDGLSKTAIRSGLENDIYGFEVDRTLIEEVTEKLDRITEQYEIPKVFWSFFCHDALSFSFFISFDYVIGNPPYLNYKSIDIKTREILRRNFLSCSTGKFDYCYAFIEKGMSVLNSHGKMVQLIPANIYKNVFGKNLRSMILPHLCEVWEYPQQKIFGETLTISSVLLIQKGQKKKTLKYVNKTSNKELVIRKDSLSSKWVFAKIGKEKNGKRFGDYFNVSISIATQLNEAFIVSENGIEDYSLESELIRKAASPRALLRGKQEYIIFPYKYSAESLTRINEDDFARDYPNVRKYLFSYYEELMKRDKDKSAKWFEYGRSQALSRINCRKLVLSTIVTDKPAVYLLDKETVPYSGIYITEKDAGYPLEIAKEWLLADSFCEYVKRIGTSVNGRSSRITCDDIKNFIVRA